MRGLLTDPWTDADALVARNAPSHVTPEQRREAFYGLPGVADRALTDFLRFSLPKVMVTPRDEMARQWRSGESNPLVDTFELGMPGAGVARPAGSLASGISRVGRPTQGLLTEADVGKRIPSRLPTAKKPLDDPLDRTLTIDREAARRAPDAYEHNVRRLTDIPGLGHLADATDPLEIEQAAMKHFEDNLNFLFSITPEGKIERNRQWYDGANRFSHTLANRYRIEPESMAGAVAALSPQKDWYQNASLAERLADIHFTRSDFVTTPEMIQVGLGGKDKKLKDPMHQQLLQSMVGKRLQDLETDLERAIWIRMYDETYNPRHYREFVPTGELGDFIKRGDGEERKVSWGSFNEISKADQSLRSGGDIDLISQLMGTKHKVRSFYNNNAEPNSPFNDVTGDTHQVAANALMPYSGKSGPVHQNFGTAPGKDDKPANWVGTKNSSVVGVHGTYPLHADAVRNVAAQHGLQGREAQSITWETIREMFTPELKRNPAFVAEVEGLWRAVERGDISANTARERIAHIAARPSRDSGARRGGGLLSPEEASTY